LAALALAAAAPALESPCSSKSSGLAAAAEQPSLLVSGSELSPRSAKEMLRDEQVRNAAEGLMELVSSPPQTTAVGAAGVGGCSPGQPAAAASAVSAGSSPQLPAAAAAGVGVAAGGEGSEQGSGVVAGGAQKPAGRKRAAATGGEGAGCSKRLRR
jgi:hypothetical protein